MARRPSGEAPPPPPPHPERAASRAPLPDWFDPAFPPLHDDMSVRVVGLPDDADWRPTRHAGLEMRVLERLGGDAPRISAQLRLAAGASSAALGHEAGLELLVQRGEIEALDSVWPAGLYVRLPVGGAERLDRLVLGADDDADASPGALLYVASGHIAAEDTEQRRIDTREESRWLPGPVTGTEVQPLHGHGSANVMLIRWRGAVAFRPRLDPLGEEVLVLRGCLHDAGGDYPAGSWIRNPVPAWQSWSGDPGTLIHYKSGHFASPPGEEAAPDPSPA